MAGTGLALLLALNTQVVGLPGTTTDSSTDWERSTLQQVPRLPREQSALAQLTRAWGSNTDASAQRPDPESVLTEHGYRVVTARDGAEALGIAHRESPDLILCDIQMPKLDGYGVLDRIRQNAATSGIPFIFLTGLGEKPKVRQAMESGADDYIVKPFNPDKIDQVVKSILG